MISAIPPLCCPILKPNSHPPIPLIAQINNMNTSIAPFKESRIELDQDGELIIPDSLTLEEFYESYRLLLHFNKRSRAWRRKLEKFGIDKYGLDAVVGVYDQIMMELGDDQTPPESLSVNPEDKTKAIITIEGISQNCSMWWRKVEPEMIGWEIPRLKKAAALLAEPKRIESCIQELIRQREASSAQRDKANTPGIPVSDETK